MVMARDVMGVINRLFRRRKSADLTDKDETDGFNPTGSSFDRDAGDTAGKVPR